MIEKCPSEEFISMFNMQESANESYRNFKIDLSILSGEQKKLLCNEFTLDQKVLNYKEELFLAIAL